MRVRTIATVVVLSAGCTRAPAPASARDRAEAPPAVTSLSAPVTAPASVGASAPRPAPPTSADLERLADELRATPDRASAATDPRFRPLCDAAGYPLVGNLITKAPPRPDRLDVSDLCAAVRGGR